MSYLKEVHGAQRIKYILHWNSHVKRAKVPAQNFCIKVLNGLFYKRIDLASNKKKCLILLENIMRNKSYLELLSE